jgi:nuclear pore complex protein Nup98-Nup96
MSGFGGFGSSGFGSNNQTSSAFSGFGSNTSTTGGFGSNPGGFGAASGAGSGLFGATSNSGFGSGKNSSSSSLVPRANRTAKGGFGSNSNATSSPFGQNKPAGFGSTTTSAGGLFGNTTATSGTGFGSSGGFGATNTNTGFGSGSTFNTNKTGFGGGNSSGLFGSTNTGGFGSTPANTNAAFATASPFGTGNQQNNGTGTTPFTPHNEKEPNTSTTNSYQTISALPAYNKYSLEELRLVDYAQGRKYGNQSGQAGAFGASTGFGGFGTTNTTNTGFGSGATSSGNTLFGSGSTSTPFGGNAPTATTGGFGSSTTGGGLFGSRPTGSGLFGSTATTSAPSGGGLFGTTGSTTGFGSTTTGSTGFGTANNTTNTGFGSTQNKPFGAFGSTTSGGFGTTNTNTGGGLFGSTATTSTPFGQPAQPSTGTGGLFGQQNQQQQQQQQQQPQTGGSMFGGFGQQANQQKPGGLFGSSATTGGTGLFGQQQPAQQSSGGLFGGGSSTQQSGGLFGQKPATPNLFGGSAGTGGGLFGNPPQQQQPSTGTGLFGSSTQQSGGLFGPKPAATSTGGLFGQPQQQQTGTSLFGSAQQAQQPGLGSSLFNSTQQQPQQAQPTHLLASLVENPYGNAQLFAGLQSPGQSLGPLATPLSSSQKKKQAVIPHHRLMPNASSRLITPQKRPGGYGFSYSAYNSPASASSNASPISMGGSLLSAGSMSRSLAKSLSTSNLRHSFTAQDSILAPGAFTNVARSGPGSMKKLNINRNLTSRRSLFGTETTGSLSKRVSFENGAVESNNTSPTTNSGALVRTEEADAVSDKATSPQAQSNGTTGKELVIIPEDQAPVTQQSSVLEIQNRKARLSQKDQTPGEYHMEPSIDEIKNMSREERSKIKNFTVSREGVGKIIFSQVDLTKIPLEDICGRIVELDLRRATVYGDNSTIKTPSQGSGMNVPSTIILENSWPRARAGRLKVPERSGHAFEKHIRLLKACKDTRFISYENDTGRWTFEVDHYTTYGLNYDDDESVMDTTMMDNTLAEADQPGALTDPQTTPLIQAGSSNASSADSVDDTFDFKRGKRVVLPGQFDEDEFEDDLVMEEDEIDEPAIRSSQPRNVPMTQPTRDEQVSERQDDLDIDMDIPQTVSGPVKAPSGIETTRDVVIPDRATPTKIDRLVLEPNWTEQLLQTASPKKRDRQTLRQNQGVSPPGYNVSERRPLELNKTVAFGTTVDIMNSLFASPKNKSRENGLEVRH